ncbi:MAG: phosphoribosylformylglycinamidine synthase subunit PurS [Calditrichia bacterium]|nr:phosphoribosylformylglycinamidine synthase subunit PurS [Calditrichia bacterium]
MLKKSILDPQGKTVLHAIQDMNIGNFSDVRIGKYIEVSFNNSNLDSAKSEIDDICKKLLSNPVMEDYDFEIEEIN